MIRLSRMRTKVVTPPISAPHELSIVLIVHGSVFCCCEDLTPSSKLTPFIEERACGMPAARATPVLCGVSKHPAPTGLLKVGIRQMDHEEAHDKAKRPTFQLRSILGARPDVCHVDSGRRSATRASRNAKHARRTISCVITRSEGLYLMPVPRGRQLPAYCLML
jgi:hypothetical protein